MAPHRTENADMSEASNMARRHMTEWKEVADGDTFQQRLMIEQAHVEFEAARDKLDLFDRADFVEAYMATSESLSEDWPGGREAAQHREACPLCGCRRVHATRAGFGVARAAAGAALFGAFGLAAGFIGACDVTMECLACGNTWPSGLDG